MGLGRRWTGWFINLLLLSLLTVLALSLLHVGHSIYEEWARPLELCDTCVMIEAKGPYMPLLDGYPYNRTCPRCHHEWRNSTSCVLRPLAESIAAWLR